MSRLIILGGGKFIWSGLRSAATQSGQAVPVLLPLLRFNYPETGYNGGMVRQYAVAALGKISSDTNVIDAIQKSLNDPDPDVQKEAERALKKHNSLARESL